MTTPIVEAYIVDEGFTTYTLNIAGNAVPFESGIAEVDSTGFVEYAYSHMEPWKIDINNTAPGVNGIFHAVPDTAVYKLTYASLLDVSGDTPEFVADISRFIIVSVDGRIVFKPNILRMLNEFVALGYVEDPNDYDAYGITIFIEGKPAYTNPSGDTPDYNLASLEIDIALDAIGVIPPFNSIDMQPYIAYGDSTNEQPAI